MENRIKRMVTVKGIALGADMRSTGTVKRWDFTLRVPLEVLANPIKMSKFEIKLMTENNYPWTSSDKMSVWIKREDEEIWDAVWDDFGNILNLRLV